MVVLHALIGCDAPETPLASIEDGVVEVGATLTPDAAWAGGEPRFTWGDGGSDAGPDHAWTAPGHYRVYLDVLDGDAVLASASASVTVHLPLAAEPIGTSSTVAWDGTRWLAVLPDHDQLAAGAERWDTCGRPRSVAVEGDLVAVACELDAVDLFDAGERTTVPLRWGARPFGVAIAGGRVYASLQGTGQVVEIGGTALDVPDARGLGVLGDLVASTSHRGAALYLGADRVDLPADPGPDSDTNARGVPNYLQRVAISPDGTRIAVAGSKANVERGEYREGRALTFETTSRSELRVLDLDGNELGSVDFDNRDLASAVAFSPLGDLIYVAHLGARVVDVIDAYGLVRVGAWLETCEGPDGLAAVGDEVAVWCPMSRELWVYPADPSVTEPLRKEVLADDALDPEVSLGRRIFHAAWDARTCEDSYLSCASCHLDGDEDHVVWDFTDRGEGLRNTIALGAGVGPIHWSANFDELQDFENDIRGPMQGHGYLTDADFEATADALGAPKAGLSAELDALAAYVATFEPPRSPFRTEDGSLPADAVAGQAAFDAEGCPACHPAPAYTDSAWVDEEPVLHDVGTITEASGQRRGEALTGLDTPSLRGAWATPPYLHDGSAATLEDAIRAHTGAADVDAIAAFVRCLE